MVQMHEDNIFQQKMLFSNLLFANGVVTCGVVMKFEWELKCKQMSAVVSCCLEWNDNIINVGLITEVKIEVVLE